MEEKKGEVSVHLEGEIVYLSFKCIDISAEEHNRIAEEMAQKYAKIKKDNPDTKFKVLVDLMEAGVPTEKARELYIKTLSDNQVEKTAFYGVGGAIRGIISFIVSAAGKGEEVKFFINRDEALEWLQA